MTPATKSWGEKLRKWQRTGDEKFAKAVMSKPGKTTIAREIPFPGVIVIMGDIRRGKTGLAFSIMDGFHKRRGLPGCLFLPFKLSPKKRKALPSWVSVVGNMAMLPKRSVVVFDEAAQTAHARRAMSSDAISLDALTALAGQRDQLIIYIAHFSRKLDPNLITAAHRVIWKEPTQAHAMFERDEMQMFTRRALEVFADIKGNVTRLRTSYVMDFRHLRFSTMTNGLPDWWCDELSRIFEDHVNKKEE